MLAGPSSLDGCDTAPQPYSIQNYDPAFTYTVTSSGSVRHLFDATTGELSVRTNGRTTGPGQLTVRAANSCGSSSRTVSISVSACTTYRYTVYPNPAQEEVTVADEPTAARSVSASATTASHGTTPEFEVTLYNGQGQPVHQGRSQGRRFRLSLHQFPAGLYQLHVGQGTQVERHTLQVTH
ncbi:T9SS type A sorting domain-containing protein [Hymenobacter metallilatus]|uniref:T9SS C-terminal target domain-containing protein n=1 Tax=Hymenobacter metallilatus TaxID=2493666 RepID=A0A428JU54_9BACT|nr:T9SS type A sorting domain-containing protein [Hymenobacter metallilatus]RSK37576.1 T9SS C-terminal target domain-containing protein [Hymenobacter metallilatus]